MSCKSGQVVADGCDAQLTALSKCSATLSVFGKTACQLGVDQVTIKLAGCPKPPQTTTTTGSGTQAECTDAAAKLVTCQVAAIVQAPCDCLGAGDQSMCTAEQSKAFSDAITACQ